MRDGQHEQLTLEDSGFFVLRTPLLPFDDLVRWSSHLPSAGPARDGHVPAVAREVWAEDIQVLRSRLKDVIARPEILQALFVASPSLESAIENWQRDPDSKKGLQAERALVRYLARMAARSTPFGLFSGCSVGVVNNTDISTDLELQPLREYRSHSRLDFDFLFALTRRLRLDPTIVQGLRFWPNSSLHGIGNSFHYIESRMKGSRRSHHITRVDRDQFLDAVLLRAQTGATVTDLSEVISRVPGGTEFSDEEVRAYLQQLIDSEVLISNLSPLLTGGAPIDDIISQVQSLSSKSPALETLIWMRDRMLVLDREGLGVAPAEYRALAKRLEELSPEFDIAHLYQVDLIKKFESGRIGRSVISELKNGVNVLCRLCDLREPEALRQFRDSFSFRYERAWIPLLEAIDPDAGIGFQGGSDSDGSPLIRGLAVDVVGRPNERGKNELQAILWKKVVACNSSEARELELELSELPRMESQLPLIPHAFEVTATLIASSSAAVNKGEFCILLRGASGPSGATLLGRFCHTDPKLETYVRMHLRKEEDNGKDGKDAIYAEIVYLPEGRIGNILCRPVLRDYEITYLGRSGANKDRQIPVSDLLVTVDGSQIILYSERLQRRVIPRMTNAHGFMNPKFAPAYRFLCYLQHQGGVGAPNFSWGQLETLDFLPRLRVGKTVLACARWRLTTRELQTIKEHDRHKCFLAVQELRRKRQLPQWIVLQEADNNLPFDLDNPLCVDAFAHVLRRVNEAIVHELYPSMNELCVAGPEGRFQHELLVPFLYRGQEAGSVKHETSEHILALPAVIFNKSKRSLPPGSDWLYLKLYAGVASLDEILSEVIAPLVRKSLASGAISRWFFVRFSDPHLHLRIRFNGHPDELRQRLLPSIDDLNVLLHNGKLWKIQFDTYEREIERYGGLNGIHAAEDVFFADSDAVLEVLGTLRDDEGLDNRWRIAILGLDRLLSDCGFNIEEKLTIMQELRSSFWQEFQGDQHLKIQLGERFRQERSKLEKLLNNEPESDTAMAVGHEAFKRRSIRVREALRQLRKSERPGYLEANVKNLASSYLHMHVNRLIRSSPRAHEFVLYNFLSRIYEGKMARERIDIDNATLV